MLHGVKCNRQDSPSDGYEKPTNWSNSGMVFWPNHLFDFPVGFSNFDFYCRPYGLHKEKLTPVPVSSWRINNIIIR